MTEATTFSGTYFYANGKRKTAVARVRLYKGNGRVVVNGQDAREYFTTEEMVNVFMAPLALVHMEKQFDISAMVQGGGIQGQAEALRHGIAMALLEFDSSLRSLLKPEGYLTRDSRAKERKKPGLHRARRAPQFSKR
ncbi:30S ribosomal protein S9 [Candidatus Peregrinibacteria bacterium]|nr:MAG: 30S ribosomal protein S9 [Candidatus Peregrinibacteria bacterium]